MSYLGLSQVVMGLHLGLREQAKFELGKLGQIVFLRWYITPEDEKLAPEKLGRHIDGGLVEYIRLQHLAVEHREIGIEEFSSEMLQIQEGMRENIALKAFAATLWQDHKVPLASETYLELAKRHALHGGESLPSSKEGRRFARVMLAPFMKVDFCETDWDMETFTRNAANSWLDSRDPDELQKLIHDSKKSPLAWDTLQLICQKLVDRGGEGLPYALLQWYLMANHGRLERPEEGPVPPHRPSKLGYKLRNNEIRHTVELLVQVGMGKEAARNAVAEEFDSGPRTIQGASRKLYSTFDDFGEDAMKRIEPRYYSYLYGPDSESGPSSSA